MEEQQSKVLVYVHNLQRSNVAHLSLSYTVLCFPPLLRTPHQAGMHAIRENRYVILPKDFEKGYKNNLKKDEQELDFYK